MLKNLGAFAFGIVLLVGLLALAELSSHFLLRRRLISPRSLPADFHPVQVDYAKTLNFAQRLKSHSSNWRTNNPAVEPIATAEGIDESEIFAGGYEQVFSRILGDRTFRSKVVTRVSKTVIYDVRISMDRFGRRKVPSFNPRAKRSIFLFGDSFTFGEGVFDQETYANQLQRKQTQFSVFNLGLPGASPATFYSEVSQPKTSRLANEQPKKDSYAFFLFIPDHLERIVCPLESYMRPVRPGFLRHPRFELSGGALKQLKPCGESVIRNALFSFLGGLAFVQTLGINIPPWYFQSHYDLAAELLRQSFGWLERQFKVTKTATVLYSYTDFETQGMAEALARKKMEVIDLRSIDFELATENLSENFGEGHPSSMSHYLIAEAINDKINGWESSRRNSTR